MTDIQATVDAANAAVFLMPFTSFFEATFGLNLAYSLIEQIHLRWLKRYGERTASVYEVFRSWAYEPGNSGRGEQNHVNDLILRWDAEDGKLIKGSELFVFVARIFAFLAAALSLLILFLSGYCPELTVSLIQFIIIICFTVIPFSVSFFGLNLHWYRKFQKREETIEKEVDIRNIIDKIKNTNNSG